MTEWASIDKDAINASVHPIDIRDKLISYKVNWDSQGYYARATYRTEMQYTILASWAFLSTYYNCAVPANADKYQPLANKVATAIKQIAARPAGMSPDKVRELNRAGKDVKVYSPTLGIAIKHSRLVTGGNSLGSNTIEIAPHQKIMEYQRHMRGSQQDDLQLAGLDVNDDPNSFLGIGFRHIATYERYHQSAKRDSKAADVTVRRAFTTILMKSMSIPVPVQTSDEEWRTESTYGRYGRSSSTNKVKDNQMHTFFWFDRA